MVIKTFFLRANDFYPTLVLAYILWVTDITEATPTCPILGPDLSANVTRNEPPEAPAWLLNVFILHYIK